LLCLPKIDTGVFDPTANNSTNDNDNHSHKKLDQRAQPDKSSNNQIDHFRSKTTDCDWSISRDSELLDTSKSG